MEIEQINQIKLLREEIGKLVTKIEPDTSPEWECLEKLTAAHKQLRSIDTSCLGQQKMEF